MNIEGAAFEAISEAGLASVLPSASGDVQEALATIGRHGFDRLQAIAKVPELDVIISEFRSYGGLVVVSRANAVILVAPRACFFALADSLTASGHSSYASSVIAALPRSEAPLWRFGNRCFDFGRRPLIMGIVNVTPDSFSDAGKCFSFDTAVAHGVEMARQGADILDVGGMSSRPGADDCSLQEELRRVVPVITDLRKALSIPISVDTWRAEVAKAAINAGADIVNDITALRGDSSMVKLVAEAGIGLVMMHTKGKPQTMQANPKYAAPVEEIASFLAQRLSFATASGINREAIAVDPGIGFGKRLSHNVQLISDLNRFAELDRPVLLGHSRKSFIGQITGRPVTDRDEETLVLSIKVALARSAHIMRVHEVRSTARAFALLERLS